MRKPLDPFRLDQPRLSPWRRSISTTFRSWPRPSIKAEEGDHLKSEISTTFLYDTRDSVFLTRHGHRIVFTPHIAGGFLGGDTETTDSMSRGRNISFSPTTSFSHSMAKSASSTPGAVATEVPIFDRLFLGGANDLRGFNFRDVGPKDE